jgi:glycyl-tRNA synthetase beta chain
MAELLVEVGCEELPASTVGPAAEQLRSSLAESLAEAGLGSDAGSCLSTPRRLIVAFQGLADRQEDSVQDVRGPSAKAAFGPDGAPSQALLGFCRGQGVDPAAVRVEGDYVWARKAVTGRDAVELLAELLPAAIKALTWPKTMRWAHGRTRFARPVRWILAAFDGRPVPFEIEGVASGLKSRGHRFESEGEFEATNLSGLLAGLRERSVEPDADVRVRRVAEGVADCSGGAAEASPALVRENADLCEWPAAHLGEFRAEFLELPEPVLVTVMAKHERFFPVRGDGGRLTNRFVAVRNGGQEAVVRRGNAWVLNARFNDARFFYLEDRKHTLEEFLAKTAGMTFQESLGTVRHRADRLSDLAAFVAEQAGLASSEVAWAREAGRLAKADLATGLVSELDELQGRIGAEYARREGLPEPVCRAIGAQYDLAAAGGDPVALSLVVADQADKLAGFLGLGLVPTGSSDPYGLRRAATLLIEAAWAWPGPLGSFGPVLERAMGLYEEQGVTLDRAAVAAAEDLFRARYASLLDGHRYDLVEAAGSGDALAPRQVRLRLSCLEALVEDTEFVQTATRPANIVAAAMKKGIAARSATGGRLDSPAGDALAQALATQAPLAAQAAQAESAGDLVAAVRPLAAPIAAFFDSTMVMVDDEAVRDARLGLLAAVAEVLALAGDFVKVVIEG